MARYRFITGRSVPGRVNFLLTNRIPRALATRIVARISRSEQPLVRAVSMRAWTLFAGPIDVRDARSTTFPSVHACFTRNLRDGARPIDRTVGVLVSPCDGIVGACGTLEGTQAFQIKGSAYDLRELLQDDGLVRRHANGCYVTLRLRSSMDHRFHAPDDCEVREVRFIHGDTFNVNPPALTRIERLFCRNERAVVPLNLVRTAERVTIVPVAAILVGSLRLHCVQEPLCRQYDGPLRLTCSASLARGDEMGYFEHGSTIVVLGTSGLRLCDEVREGRTMRMGQPLLCHA